MSLIYKTAFNFTGVTNVLLIDNSVTDYQTFVDSANATTFPIVYSYDATKTDLLNLLQNNFTAIPRIGVVFKSNGPNAVPFLDNQLLFSDNETSPYSENTQFIINLIKQFNVANIDYLACNTLNSISYTNYYNILLLETGVTVGASNDATGNIKYGGDWVMESTSQDIELIYFTQNIEYYTYLLDTGGSGTFVVTPLNLYGCGSNSSGQLGLGDTTNRNSLTSISMPLGKIFKNLSAGTNGHTIMLMTDGTIYGTGINNNGQLGLGNTTNRNSLTSISMPLGKIVKQVSCGAWSTIMLMTDGTVYGVGDNYSGNFGFSNTGATDILSLTPFPLPPNKTVNQMLGVGGSHTILLMTDGTIYCTGNNVDGQLGLGDTTNRYSLTPFPLPPNKKVKQVSTGNRHTIVLMTDGTIYSTGYNNNGQLGLGDATITSRVLSLITFSETVINLWNYNEIDITCFKEGTKILTCNGYKSIQELKKRDLIKTVEHGYVPINMIGKSKITNPNNNDRIKNRLYICKKENYPEAFEDLIITGCHSILVDKFTDDLQRENTIKINGDTYLTNNYCRVPACADERAIPYTEEGVFNIYHIALDNDDYYMNYGIYANGILVETCSKRYLKELSSMKLLD